jgi:hypothetical protein
MIVESEILNAVFVKSAMLRGVTSYISVNILHTLQKNTDDRSRGLKSKSNKQRQTERENSKPIRSSETSVNFYHTTRHHVSSRSYEMYSIRHARFSICEPIVYTMWDPRRLTTLQASMNSFGDSIASPPPFF